MSTPLIIGLVVVVVAVVAIAMWYSTRQRQRREELREQFGPEYDRTVNEYGAERKAEQVLAERQERVEQLHLQPLSPEQSADYASQWRSVQAQFVDDPERAISAADRVLIDVMQRRGYPMVDFEQRAADISVGHADVVDHYRSAHAVAERAERGDATTEDLRQAMVHYRSLFDALVETREHTEATR